MKKDKDIIEIIADEPYNGDSVFTVGNAADDAGNITYNNTDENIINDIIIGDNIDEFTINDNLENNNVADDSKSTSNSSAASLKERVSLYFSNLPQDLSSGLIKKSAVLCTAAVITALVLGLVLPKSDSTVAKRLDALHNTDKTYISVSADNDDAMREKERMDTRLLNKQKELEEFSASQDNLDKISESNDALQQEKETLQTEVKEKQNTLAKLESSVTSQTKKIITWSSGRYTVGKNIAAGNYMVTGSGSISIGNSGKSLANKNLKSDGESFILNDGDIIQIDGNAKFVPQ